MILAVLMGAAGGVISGMLGVGGGTLFVPALALVLGLSQLRAEATSLLAIIPVALAGSVRQYSYGNVRVRDGVLLGAMSALGVAGGVALANQLSNRELRVGFAALMLLVAAQFLRRFWRAQQARAGDEAGRPGGRGHDERTSIQADEPSS